MSARRFKPYPAYKDSGVEWLGEIPAGWAVKKWRYCCRVTEGQVAPDDDRFRDRVMIAPNHIESGTGRILYTETADEQGAISGKYLVRPGDIIYSKIRPALNKACIATGDWLCSADMYPVAITEENLHARFLLYHILSEPFVRLMVDESMRVAMPKVNREKLATCPLAIPSQIEQDAIAAFLDRETSRIDALVAKKERLIELLQEQRTALITRAVTKGLDPNVPMKDSGVEWLGEIPAHWNTRQGRYLHRALELAPQEGDGVVTAYRDGQVTLRENRRAEGYTFAIQEVGYQHVRAGDLVLQGMDAFAGAIGVSDSNGKCSPEYLVLDPVVPGTDNRYFAAALRLMAKRGYILVICNAVRERAPRFRVPEFRNVVLPQPPAEEQRAIAVFLDREAARIDALVAKVRDAIDHLKELRTALISAAVTGKIDVREEVA